MIPIREQYLSWPSQLTETYSKALEARQGSVDLGEHRLVLGCGMGGSGFSLYAIKPLMEEAKPYIVERSDRLPSYVNDRDLVVGVSYSGETYETISCVRKALEKGAKTAIVAGRDSTLYNLGVKNKSAIVGIEKKGHPRSSLASLVGGLLALLLGDTVKDQVDVIAGQLRVGKAEEIAGEVAGLIWNQGDPLTPIIASCGPLGFVAERWATELAENAKHPALVEIFPEAGHNAVARWYYTRGRYATIYIDLSQDRLCRLVKAHIEEHYSSIGPVKVVDATAEAASHPLAGVLYSALIAGLASVRLAEYMGRDPEVIEGISLYKKSVTGRLA
ncbi:MAG: SIS domain-containing protein [Desulfurococcales archaeon]|nr:SIS domain-containing protein [Desulfurococcales archaeon]